MSDQTVAETLELAAHRRRVQNFILGSVIVVVLSIIAVGIWLSARALKEIQNTGEYLRECTTPSTDVEFHRCYEDGQRRTAEAIQTLVDSQQFYAERQLCLLAYPIEERDRDVQSQCEMQAQRLVERDN